MNLAPSTFLHNKICVALEYLQWVYINTLFYKKNLPNQIPIIYRYFTSLEDQSEQLFEHIKDAHDAVEPFIDLEEDSKHGGDSDVDHRSGDCFTDFTQFPKLTPNLNLLRMVMVNEMHGIGDVGYGVPWDLTCLLEVANLVV